MWLPEEAWNRTGLNSSLSGTPGRYEEGLSDRMQMAIAKLDHYAKLYDVVIFTFFIILAVGVVITQRISAQRHRGHEYMLMPTAPVPAYMSVVSRNDVPKTADST
ncbi:uncharacterized protein LOC125178927 [Hyalella azteca]|uniref:Uncharacterized protein LOC125178927 n=1 Tax=Hyalella azteca TaxID=294128 RepID=A0A979FRL1_HYAAZ|nr:uncharacterized protein LOC125178927 [Hyalella azteca]